MPSDKTTLPALEVFRAGTHVDSKGRKLTFTDADIAAAAAAYDPSVYAAPLVIGHPTMDAPAFGQLGKLENRNGTLVASDHTDVHPEFAALVHEKRYPKWSISFFQPDHPANPKPGVYYPRHLGFLGAAAPAVPGLKMLPASFAADDAHVVEFGTYDLGTVASLMRGLKNFFLTRFGGTPEAAAQIETAMPEYQIESLVLNAAQERAEARPLGYAAEPPAQPPVGDDMSAQELLAAKAATEAAEARAKAAEQKLADAARATRAVEYAAQADKLIAAFELHPEERADYVAFCMYADEHGTFDFAAGDIDVKAFNAQAFLSSFIKRRGKLLEPGEIAKGKNKADAGAPVAFAAPEGLSVDPESAERVSRAHQYAQEHKVSFVEALKHVA